MWYVHDEMCSTQCVRRTQLDVKMYCCRSHDFTSSYLVVNTAPTVSHRLERDARVLLYHSCCRTAVAAAVVVLLFCRCCRSRSRQSRGRALLRNSEEVWFNTVMPPQTHRSLRLPACVHFGFVRWQEA